MANAGSRGGGSTPEIQRFLGDLVARGIVSAAVARVGETGGRGSLATAGERVAGGGEPVGADDLFDVASLTKPFVATLALRLEARGLLGLETAIGDLLPDARPELARRTCEDLLRHRAGLAPWFPLWTLFEPHPSGPARRGAELGGLPAQPLAQTQRREETGAANVGRPHPPSDWTKSERVPRSERQRGWEREWGSHRRRDRQVPAASPEASVEAEDIVLRWLAERAPLGAEPGTYSDLGYLLWCRLATQATGVGLFELLRREVLDPLDLDPADVAEPPVEPHRAVECALDSGRERELAAGLGLALDGGHGLDVGPWRGVAQDANARCLGGVPGHAGLFASARALERLGREWLLPDALLERRGVGRALGGPPGPFALGWARQSADGSSGASLPAAAFGHTGFTGGSLWIDPERERVLVLLAHRIETAVDFNPHRRAYHELVRSLLG